MDFESLPSRITLISHAPTIALKRAVFPLDESLEEDEISKITAMFWVAPRAHHIWCGPEKRTQQTAEALGFKPVISVELADIDYGTWKGKEIGEIQTSDLEGLTDWLTNPDAAPHGGSSFVQLVARVERWMEQQVGRGHTLAVTHSSVIRAAILCAIGASPECFSRVEIAPLSVTDLRFNGRTWMVRATGCRLEQS